MKLKKSVFIELLTEKKRYVLKSKNGVEFYE